MGAWLCMCINKLIGVSLVYDCIDVSFENSLYEYGVWAYICMGV